MPTRTSVTAYLRYIAANTRRLRIRKGWTQEYLAECASIEPRYVHSMEAARANPTVKVLVSVAEVLGVHPTVLFRSSTFSRSPPGRPSEAKRKKRL